MKKLLLLLMILPLVSIAQPKEKTFNTYYSLSGGVSSLNDKSFSAEIGCWGIKKPVMYGISLDYVNQNTFYAGIKPYYQLTQGENYYLFTYFCPKLNLSQKNDYLLEFGVTNYTQISKTIYSSFGIGFQSAKTYNLIPSLSLGINLVL